MKKLIIISIHFLSFYSFSFSQNKSFIYSIALDKSLSNKHYFSLIEHLQEPSSIFLYRNYSFDFPVKKKEAVFFCDSKRFNFSKKEILEEDNYRYRNSLQRENISGVNVTSNKLQKKQMISLTDVRQRIPFLINSLLHVPSYYNMYADLRSSIKKRV